MDMTIVLSIKGLLVLDSGRDESDQPKKIQKYVQSDGPRVNGGL